MTRKAMPPTAMGRPKSRGHGALFIFLLLAGCAAPAATPAGAPSQLGTDQPTGSFNFTGAVALRIEVTGPGSYIALNTTTDAAPPSATSFFIGEDADSDRHWLMVRRSGDPPLIGGFPLNARLAQNEGDPFPDLAVWDIDEDWWNRPLVIVAMHASGEEGMPFGLDVKGEGVRILGPVETGPALVLSPDAWRGGARQAVKQGPLGASVAVTRSVEWTTTRGMLVAYAGAPPYATARYEDLTLRLPNHTWTSHRASSTGFAHVEVPSDEERMNPGLFFLTTDQKHLGLEIQARAVTSSAYDVLLISDMRPTFLTSTRLY